MGIVCGIIISSTKFSIGLVWDIKGSFEFSSQMNRSIFQLFVSVCLGLGQERMCRPWKSQVLTTSANCSMADFDGRLRWPTCSVRGALDIASLLAQNANYCQCTSSPSQPKNVTTLLYNETAHTLFPHGIYSSTTDEALFLKLPSNRRCQHGQH